MTDLLLVRATENRVLNSDKAGPGVGAVEARTFFALPGSVAGTAWIFAPLTDPRSRNLHPTDRVGLAPGAALLRSVGLRPEDHTMWYTDQIEERIHTWIGWHVNDAANAVFGTSGGLDTSEATDPKEQVIPYADLEPDELRARIVALEEDRAKVAEALKSEAVERGWCEDYEAFVERVNPRLNEPAFEKREQEFSVRIIVDLRVTAANLNQARRLGADLTRNAVRGRRHDKIRVVATSEGL